MGTLVFLAVFHRNAQRCSEVPLSGVSYDFCHTKALIMAPFHTKASIMAPNDLQKPHFDHTLAYETLDYGTSLRIYNLIEAANLPLYRKLGQVLNVVKIVILL